MDTKGYEKLQQRAEKLNRLPIIVQTIDKQIAELEDIKQHLEPEHALTTSIDRMIEKLDNYLNNGQIDMNSLKGLKITMEAHKFLKLLQTPEPDLSGKPESSTDTDNKSDTASDSTLNSPR